MQQFDKEILHEKRGWKQVILIKKAIHSNSNSKVAVLLLKLVMLLYRAQPFWTNMEFLWRSNLRIWQPLCCPEHGILYSSYSCTLCNLLAKMRNAFSRNIWLQKLYCAMSTKNVFILSKMRYVITYLPYCDAQSEKKNLLFTLNMDIGIDARMVLRSCKCCLQAIQLSFKKWRAHAACS